MQAQHRITFLASLIEEEDYCLNQVAQISYPTWSSDSDISVPPLATTVTLCANASWAISGTHVLRLHPQLSFSDALFHMLDTSSPYSAFTRVTPGLICF
jgi:hypothetical protein